MLVVSGGIVARGIEAPVCAAVGVTQALHDAADAHLVEVDAEALMDLACHICQAPALLRCLGRASGNDRRQFCLLSSRKLRRGLVVKDSKPVDPGSLRW